MGSPPPGRRYCRCGTRLATDNPGHQCASCQRASRDKLLAPPPVPAGFWQTDQLRDAFAQQHMGRVARAYRLHPHHRPTYGLDGIPQRLLGQWMGHSQVQISRIETGPPIRNLDTLAYWARTLRIPVELLWFDLLGGTRQVITTEPAVNPPVVPASNGPNCVPELSGTQALMISADELGKAEHIELRRLSKEQRSTGVEPCADTSDEQVNDPE
ncbi:MAG: hypothetical protein LC799_15230, partial [Actinobacteria bacterium]|nr:hypothetical protein [Actinomycetota bacterium]